MDRILNAVRARVLKGIQNQDDLWVESENIPTRLAPSYRRVDTDFVVVNEETLVIHVEDGDELRSFKVTVKEMED